MFGAAQLKILLMSCQIVNITYYWPAIVHCEYEYASASCLFYNPHITLIYLYPAKAGVSHLFPILRVPCLVDMCNCNAEQQSSWMSSR